MRHRETELGNQVFCGDGMKKGGVLANRWIESQPMVEFEFKAYRRTFADPYSTATDSLPKRAGILIRLRDKDGQIGFGEIAPIESFGSESLVSALAACSQLEGKIEYDKVSNELIDYPCLQFGLETALAMMGRDPLWPEFSDPKEVSGLLPDIGDRGRIEKLAGEGYSCLKLKIGKKDFALERRALEEVVELTEGSIRLRLDANGGFDLKLTRAWLEGLEGLPVEFLEQPMSKGEEATMLKLANDYPTPIALDESVVRVDDLKRWKDEHWPGLFVVKPSLAGSYESLVAELKTGDTSSIVFSSSLETKIGTSHSLAIALESGPLKRALGFGVGDLFADEGISPDLGPYLNPNGFPALEELEELWSRI